MSVRVICDMTKPRRQKGSRAGKGAGYFDGDTRNNSNLGVDDSGSESTASWGALFSLVTKISLLFFAAIVSGAISKMFPTNREYKKRYSWFESDKLPSSDDEKSNPYSILGVSKGASMDDIKKAYRKLALLYHPDRLAGKTDQEKIDAENKMKDINYAYENIQKDILNEENKEEDKETDHFNEDEYDSHATTNRHHKSRPSSMNTGKTKKSKNNEKQKTNNSTNNKRDKNKSSIPKQFYDEDEGEDHGIDPLHHSMDSSELKTDKDFDKAFKEFQKRHQEELRVFITEQYKSTNNNSNHSHHHQNDSNILNNRNYSSIFDGPSPFQHPNNNNNSNESNHTKHGLTSSGNPKKKKNKNKNDINLKNNNSNNNGSIPKSSATNTTSSNNNINNINNNADVDNNDKNAHKKENLDPFKPLHSSPTFHPLPPLSPPLPIFYTCTDDLAIVIRKDLLIIFLELTAPPSTTASNTSLPVSLYDPIDEDGNTPLHYCAYFHNSSLGDRILTTVGDNWWRTVIAKNRYGLTPYQVGLSFDMKEDIRDENYHHQLLQQLQQQQQPSTATSTGGDATKHHERYIDRGTSAFLLRLKQLEDSATTHRHDLEIQHSRTFDWRSMGIFVMTYSTVFVAGYMSCYRSGEKSNITLFELMVISAVVTLNPTELLSIANTVEICILGWILWRLFLYVLFKTSFIVLTIVCCTILSSTMMYRTGLFKLSFIIYTIVFMHVFLSYLLNLIPKLTNIMLGWIISILPSLLKYLNLSSDLTSLWLKRISKLSKDPEFIKTITIVMFWICFGVIQSVFYSF